MTTLDTNPPLAKACRLSEAAANVSWQFMLLKEEKSDDLRQLACAEAARICSALEKASEVVTASTDSQNAVQLGQAIKRRLIEDRQRVQPMLRRILDFLPRIQETLKISELTPDQTQFLQSEFAALSLVLQDRGL